MATRRQVSIYINGKEVVNSIKSITAEKRKLSREINNLVVGSEEYENKVKELRKLNGVIDDHRKNIRGVETTWQKVSGAIGKFGAVAGIAFTADVIVDYGKQLFNLGAEMELLGQKAETVFAETLPQVTRAAEENATAMGLTIGQYIDAAAAIGDLLVPMGFARQEAADISTELVNLSGALSEWTGGQIAAEDVARTLSKAMLGEREELKQLGIAISEADVQARLAEKGMKNLTGEMLQQAKAAATLELITEKSVDAQTAFANNTDTIVRKQAELRAQIQSIQEAIATALIPVFSRLVGVVSQAVTFFTNLADPLGRITNTFDDQQRTVADLEKNLVPLLDRYEELQGRTNLTAEEQQELSDVIQQIGDITPSAITQIDEYGNALSINADASRDFLEAERARLAFVNQESIEGIEKLITRLEAQRKAQQDLVETGKQQIATTAGLIDVALNDQAINNARDKIADITRQIQGARAELARLSGDNLGGNAPATPDAPGNTTLSPTADELAAQEERAKKLAEQRQKQAEREEADLQKRLERLQEITQQFETENTNARLSEEDRKLAELAAKYDEQIQTALELERKGVQAATAQRLELERQKEIALQQLREEYLNAELAQAAEHEQKKAEQELLFDVTKKEVERQIEEQARQVLLEERELELLELEEHYQELIALAEKYGVDTLQLENAFQKEKNNLLKKGEEEDQKQLEGEIEGRARILSEKFRAISSVVSEYINLIGEETSAGVALSKGLALAQIAISSSEAIAKATAASAGVAFPGNIVAIGTAVATVLANIAQARKLLSDAKVPQKYTGGWLTATGADDNRQYRARYIGQAATGMLPGHAVLMNTSAGPVLASERGAEYFVSNRDLRNPYVMNYVQAIDNIVKYRQFQNGGATAPLPDPATGAQAAPATTAELLAVLQNLTQVLQQLQQKGVIAVIPDGTVLDINDRFGELNEASGGIL